MEHRKELEALNKQSLEKLEEYLKTKKEMEGEDSAKLHLAKKDWQEAWNKLMEVLVVLERFEL
jgi:hypothetical protein